MTDIFLVAGATGGLGQLIVSKLLLQKQYVRVLVRDPQKARALLGENLELVEGDTRREDTVHAAVQGVQVVLCATGARGEEPGNDAERVDYLGVSHLATAAAHSGARRFLLVSSTGVSHPERAGSGGQDALRWKRQGEDAVRQSGMIYTIVRAGELTDEPGHEHAIRVDQGDRIRGPIARADLAEVCIRAASLDSTRNATFEVVAAEGPPPEDWEALFADLKSDYEASANAG